MLTIYYKQNQNVGYLEVHKFSEFLFKVETAVDFQVLMMWSKKLLQKILLTSCESGIQK